MTEKEAMDFVLATFPHAHCVPSSHWHVWKIESGFDAYSRITWFDFDSYTADKAWMYAAEQIALSFAGKAASPSGYGSCSHIWMALFSGWATVPGTLG